MPDEKVLQTENSGALFGPDSDWWHNARLNVFGIDINAYAIGYRQAADFLVERVSQERRYQDTLVYPIAFLYRQYLGLRLKQLVHLSKILLDHPRAERNLHHGILKLWQEYRGILEELHPGEYADDFDKIEVRVAEFDYIDPSSIAFRYPTNKEGDPSLDGLSHINVRKLAGALGEIPLILEGAASELDKLLQDRVERDSLPGT